MMHHDNQHKPKLSNQGRAESFVEYALGHLVRTYLVLNQIHDR